MFLSTVELSGASVRIKGGVRISEGQIIRAILYLKQLNRYLILQQQIYFRQNLNI